MLRNREFKIFIIITAVLTAVLSAAGFYFNKEAGLFALVTGINITALCVIFTCVRYRKIQNLIGYIERICSGEYGLDVRDNTEGELSILKNELHRVTRILREQSQMLEDDKLELAKAMSNISHQLKTPLTAMMMMSDFLQDDSLPADKRSEFSSELRAQLERMEWLISALLKLSKLDAGTVEFKKENTNVRALTLKAAAPLSVPLDVHNQTLEVNIPNDIFIPCDIDWTAEALLNIIKNCSEHTPNGGKIKVTAEDSPILTTLTVEDSGDGINKEDLPHLFERFYRGKNAKKDSVGIGLAMAREIMLSQNGDITAENGESGGKFTVRIYKNNI